MTPGTIGVISGDLTRYADFSMALMHAQTPPGSKLIWTKGVDVVQNMNRMCRGMKGDWLWMIGDDHVFDPDLLKRLLGHNVDVVVPLCLKRLPPYDPTVYTHQNDNGHYVGDTDLPEHGLVEVYASGNAGMLVRRRVLDAIGDPWFESARDGLGEDLLFCAKLREVGFKIHVDVDARLGHIGLVTVWPNYADDEWQISLDLGNGQVMPVRRFVDPELAGVPSQTMRRLNYELAHGELLDVGLEHYGEFFVSNTFAHELLNGGMKTVDGRQGSLSVIEEFENAVQLRWTPRLGDKDGPSVVTWGGWGAVPE